jgi:hypothetical protein
MHVRIFYASANILIIFSNEFLLDFVAAKICVYFQYLFMHFVCANIFGAIVLKPRFKIDGCSYNDYMKYCDYY